MSKIRRVLISAALAAGMLVAVAIGAVFPIPPLMILARRRRTDRTALVLPAVPGAGLDLRRPVVPSSLLERTTPA